MKDRGASTSVRDVTGGRKGGGGEGAILILIILLSRHDCQDGQDEHGCKFEEQEFPKHFW